MNKLTKEEFIKRANLIHNNKYDYSLVYNFTDKSKVKIICPIHGIFTQKIENHLNGHGCPKCKSPKGEKIIAQLLKEKDIKFSIAKKYDDLKDVKKLSYDFYIPDYNLLIEYNGIQHYVNAFRKPTHEFHRQLHHDWLKRKYAEKNNINLLVISYKDNIEDKLTSILCTYAYSASSIAR